jgi:NAD-dependent dihydropyrimidine dehydrogenase PreA subunit
LPFVIAQACVDVKDRSCVEVCPVDCIYTDPEDRMCYIHPTDCIDCAVCEAACPVQAIYASKDLPGESVAFVDINALWFRDKAAARGAVERSVPSS